MRIAKRKIRTEASFALPASLADMSLLERSNGVLAVKPASPIALGAKLLLLVGIAISTATVVGMAIQISINVVESSQQTQQRRETKDVPREIKVSFDLPKGAYENYRVRVGHDLVIHLNSEECAKLIDVSIADAKLSQDYDLVVTRSASASNDATVTVSIAGPPSIKVVPIKLGIPAEAEDKFKLTNKMLYAGLESPILNNSNKLEFHVSIPAELKNLSYRVYLRPEIARMPGAKVEMPNSKLGFLFKRNLSGTEIQFNGKRLSSRARRTTQSEGGIPYIEFICQRKNPGLYTSIRIGQIHNGRSENLQIFENLEVPVESDTLNFALKSKVFGEIGSFSGIPTFGYGR
jgi:hypothetical protein